jgi:hypothetical protein
LTVAAECGSGVREKGKKKMGLITFFQKFLLTCCFFCGKLKITYSFVAQTFGGPPPAKPRQSGCGAGASRRAFTGLIASGDPKSRAPTAIVWEKKKAVMQKSISRKIFALALAAMMLVSVSAYAEPVGEEVDGEITTPVNTQLWFANTALTAQFPQTLDIDFGNGVTTPTAYTLGNNTIRRFVKSGGIYSILLSQQFFAPYTTPPGPNYDDSANAQYVMNISEVFVLTPSGRYVSCYNHGILNIPDAYALPEPKVDELYFQCKIFSTIGDLTTGESFPPNWNGGIVYLKIDLTP